MSPINSFNLEPCHQQTQALDKRCCNKRHISNRYQQHVIHCYYWTLNTLIIPASDDTGSFFLSIHWSSEFVHFFFFSPGHRATHPPSVFPPAWIPHFPREGTEQEFLGGPVPRSWGTKFWAGWNQVDIRWPWILYTYINSCFFWGGDEILYPVIWGL